MNDSILVQANNLKTQIQKLNVALSGLSSVSNTDYDKLVLLQRYKAQLSSELRTQLDKQINFSVSLMHGKIIKAIENLQTELDSL